MEILLVCLMGIVTVVIGRWLAGRGKTSLDRQVKEPLHQRLLRGLPGFLYFLLGALSSVFAEEIRTFLGL